MRTLALTQLQRCVLLPERNVYPGSVANIASVTKTR